MLTWVSRIVVVLAAACSMAACEQVPPLAPTGPGAGTAESSTGCGAITRTETLTGSAIGGVRPSGRAVATLYRSFCGTSNSLRVTVSNVNYPDGTPLAVSIDFTPIGTIVVSGRAGAVTADLGKFAVSNDEVRVKAGSTVILIGPYFK